MIEFKVRGSRSWFDHRCGRKLAAELAERLVERVGNEDARFLTLTYRRDPYEDPQDLYRRSQEERHVRVFVGRLGRALKRSMGGRWICKMEFQQGGWIHWHLLLVGVGFVSHELLMKLWGHGNVWIDRANEKRIRYVCKYIAKDGELPAWVYMEAIRSVKIVRVSPGFWDNPSVQRDGHRGQKLSAYISIGEMVERGSERMVARDGDGRWWAGKMDAWKLFELLRSAGGESVPAERGWYRVDHVNWELFVKLAGAARAAAAQPHLGGAAAAAALHLTDTPIPPFRRFLTEFWLWQVAYRDEPESFQRVCGDESDSG